MRDDFSDTKTHAHTRAIIIPHLLARTAVGALWRASRGGGRLKSGVGGGGVGFNATNTHSRAAWLHTAGSHLASAPGGGPPDRYRPGRTGPAGRAGAMRRSARWRAACPPRKGACVGARGCQRGLCVGARIEARNKTKENRCVFWFSTLHNKKNRFPAAPNAAPGGRALDDRGAGGDVRAERRAWLAGCARGKGEGQGGRPQPHPPPLLPRTRSPWSTLWPQRPPAGARRGPVCERKKKVGGERL